MKSKEKIDEIISRQDIIETFVKYYGEENRGVITQKINNLKFKYGYTDVVGYKINAKIKQKYQDKIADWEKISETIIGMLENLADENAVVDAKCLAKEANVLTELGFDYHKIIKRTQEGLFEIVNGTETKKLKEYIKNFSTSSKKDNINSFNVEKWVDLYNQCAKEKVLASSTIAIKYYKQYGTVEDEHLKEYTIEDNTPFLYIENLDKKKKEFLYDFLTSKGPMSLWNESHTNYVVSGFNVLFNKNYRNLQEVIKDPQLKMFLDFKTEVMTDVVNGYFVTEAIESSRKDFGEDSTTQTNIYKKLDLGSYCPSSNVLNVGLGKDTSISTIIHECGHCLATHQNKKGLSETGFAYTGFNEVVNEFLTQKIVEKLDSDMVEKSSVKLDSKKCAYTPAVEFMKDFLNKYEPILKKCQLDSANCTKKLIGFVGTENAKNLIRIGGQLEMCGYGQLLPRIEECGKSINDLLEDFKKNPNKEEYKAWEKILHKFESMQHFMNEMVEKYSEFEQGKITNISMGNIESEQEAI
jgi:hypothetical protein